MARAFPLVLGVLATACGGSEPPPIASTPPPPPTAAAPVPAPPASIYPAARRADTADLKFGVRVADPYRWMEQMDSEETKAWVKAENQVTDAYFKKISGQDRLRARFAELLKVETYFSPHEAGGRFFWLHGDGKKDQMVLETATSIDGTPTVLIDPNPDAAGGANTMTGFIVAPTGKRIAYGVSTAAGDWESFHFRDVDGKADLPDVLPNMKYYPPVFTHDGKAVYYSRFPAPKPGTELTETDHENKVYRHEIGQPVDKDVVVYERTESPTWQYWPWMSEDGHFLVLSIGDGEVGDRGQEQIVAFDLTQKSPKPMALVDRFESEFIPVGSDGTTIFFTTDLDAPTKRVIAIDTKKPDRTQWKEILPASQDALAEAHVVGGKLVAGHMHDVHSALAVYDLKGKKLRDVELPGLGLARLELGAGKELFFGFTSFTVPLTFYRYDLAKGVATVWKTPKVPFDASALETKQIFYPSKDGTKVPMFVIAKKGLPLDGENPTIITGYGGGGIPFPPAFHSDMIAWIERGGVYVLANIRGGGEYGVAWHHAAWRDKRQVTYDDFIAAAEALIAQKITSTPHLGMTGRSGGGEMVSAVLMQRPDLYGACAPIAGVMDMMRFHLFGEGAGWQGDFGSPDEAEEFKVLYATSPLHNVKKGATYPPTLIITADHDVRVAPLHSYKLAAAMQDAQAGPAPVILRVQTNSGHHGGDLVSQKIEQDAELLAFFARELGLVI